MRNFDGIVKSAIVLDNLKCLLEADTGVSNPAASSNNTIAAAGGGTPVVPSKATELRTRIVQALDKSKLGSVSRTAAMAVGKSPMDRWNFPPDAGNVYTLDPRGSSTVVISRFEAAITSGTTAPETETSAQAVESVSFKKYYKFLMENDATNIKSVSSQEGEEDTKRREYVSNQAQQYIKDVKFQKGQNYNYVSAKGKASTVTVTALPGEKVSGGIVAPNAVQVQMGNNLIAVPVINSNWKFSIGPSAGQDVPSESPDKLIPPEGNSKQTAVGDNISVSNPKWVDSMKKMIIHARSARGDAQPIRLVDFAVGDFIVITDDKIQQKAKELMAADVGHSLNDPSFQREFDNGTIDGKEEYMQKAKSYLEREKSKSNTDLNLLHGELKKAFMKAGLYCGTEEQFETFKKGISGALGAVGKAVSGVLKPTASISTGVFA